VDGRKALVKILSIASSHLEARRSNTHRSSLSQDSLTPSLRELRHDLDGLQLIQLLQ
jgi:hypothetical protein